MQLDTEPMDFNMGDYCSTVNLHNHVFIVVHLTYAHVKVCEDIWT